MVRQGPRTETWGLAAAVAVLLLQSETLLQTLLVSLPLPDSLLLDELELTSGEEMPLLKMGDGAGYAQSTCEAVLLRPRLSCVFPPTNDLGVSLSLSFCW